MHGYARDAAHRVAVIRSANLINIYSHTSLILTAIVTHLLVAQAHMERGNASGAVPADRMWGLHIAPRQGGQANNGGYNSNSL